MVEARHAVAGVLALLVGMGAPRAAGLPVIDVPNLVQSIVEVQQSLEQLEQTYLQVRMVEQQLRSMDAAQLAGFAADITGSPELRQIEQAIAAHRDLMASVERLKQTFQERLDTARLMGRNWRDYVEGERRRIARREGAAIARVNAEVQAMRRIEADFAFAREQAGRIAHSAGTHEAVQQLNVQFNRMIQQNAEMLRQFSTAFGRHAAEREMQEAEDAERRRAQQEAYRSAADAVEAADRAAIQSWRAPRP